MIRCWCNSLTGWRSRGSGKEQAEKRKWKAQDKGLHFICFLRPEEKAGMEDRCAGILSTATYWKITHITSHRPDIMLWSQTTNQVALLELTVPWEETIKEAHEQAGEIPVPYLQESTEGMESLEFSSGGRLQGLPWIVTLESIGDAWGQRGNSQEPGA